MRRWGKSAAFLAIAMALAACGTGGTAAAPDVIRTCHAVDSVIVSVATPGDGMNGQVIDAEISASEKDGSTGNNPDLRREALSAQSSAGKNTKSESDDIEAMAETC